MRLDIVEKVPSYWVSNLLTHLELLAFQPSTFPQLTDVPLCGTHLLAHLGPQRMQVR